MKRLKLCSFVLSFVLILLSMSAFLPASTVDASCIKVRSKYANALGKSFKSLKKKYGWKLKDGSWHSGNVYLFPVKNKPIWFAFEGDITSDDFKMVESAECVYIDTTKLKYIVSGMKKDMSAEQFGSKLYSSRTYS